MSQCLAKSPLDPPGLVTHHSMAQRFLVRTSVRAALTRWNSSTHLAVAVPPGIILPWLVYFFSAFFPFPVPEGVALGLRVASELEEGSEEVLDAAGALEGG